MTSHVAASGHKSGEGDRVTANGHGNLLDEQGIASAVDAIGSSPKTATDHVESDPSETGSDPRIATNLPESESEPNATGSGQKAATDHAATAHGRTATETRPAADALDCLTTGGKQSESENDGTGHESWPYDPSLFLDPKIGKHGRIENGSRPPKTLPTHHVEERAVMSRERQPRKRSGQGRPLRTSNLPLPSSRRSRGSRSSLARTGRATRDTSTPLAGPRSSGRRGSLTGRSTKCIPRPPPPLLACLPQGREEEEEEASGRKTSEEVPARGEVAVAGGREPEGRECYLSLYERFLAKASHCDGDHPTQKSQVMSLV